MTTAAGPARQSVTDRIRTHLELLRDRVHGVSGSLAATSDGMVIAHDAPELEPAQIAALAAATLSVARRSVLAAGCGDFRETVARGSDGYLAVYAAGDRAIVAVTGTSELNVGMLQYQAREVIERIAESATALGPRVPLVPPPEPAPAPVTLRIPAPAAEPADAGGAEPVSRPGGRLNLPRRRPGAQSR